MAGCPAAASSAAAIIHLGGTHALGVQKCRLVAGSKSRALYNAELISERHRHR